MEKKDYNLTEEEKKLLQTMSQDMEKDKKKNFGKNRHFMEEGKIYFPIGLPAVEKQISKIS